jgi:hypothetical protein
MLPPLSDTPMVSMLMATYNQDQYVVDAVTSALAVEWPQERLEIIVLDDGSTDRTAELLAPFADRVRILRQPNGGLHAAVGRLMDEARGDVIILGPAGDDEAVPGRVRRLVDALRANPDAGLVYSDLEVIDAVGRTVAPSYMDLHRLRRASGRLRGQLLQGNFVSANGCALRGCLKSVVHPLPAYAEWEDFWWAWAVSGVADVVHLPAVTGRYRTHGANMTHGATGAQMIGATQSELRFRRWMFGAIDASEVTTDELLHGLRTYWEALTYLTRLTGEPFAAGDSCDEQDERAADAHFAEAARALDTGDVFGAALACARGAAACPHRIEDPGLMAAIHRAHTAVPTATLSTRRFVVIADGDELVERPALVEAYGRSFAADDDVSLVIHTPGWSPARMASVLPALVEQFDLDGPQSPDIVGVSDVPGGRPALLRRAGARLSTDAAGAVPAFAESGMGDLHQLVGERARPLGSRPWLRVTVPA